MEYIKRSTVAESWRPLGFFLEKLLDGKFHKMREKGNFALKRGLSFLDTLSIYGIMVIILYTSSENWLDNLFVKFYGFIFNTFEVILKELPKRDQKKIKIENMIENLSCNFSGIFKLFGYQKFTKKSTNAFKVLFVGALPA